MLSWRSPGDPQAGGAEVLSHEVLSRAVRRGHEVTWFGARYPGSAVREDVDGIRVLRAGRQFTVHAQAWRWLRNRQDEFDVVVDQVNTLPFATPLYVPEQRRRLLIFQTARGYWWRQTRGIFRIVAPFGYALEPLYLRLYRRTRTITISESTCCELRRLGFIGPIEMIPMAVTLPPVPQLDPKRAPFRVAIVGRLTPAKFVEEGVEAFRLFASAAPDARLDIAGSGDPTYRTKLERIVSSGNLEDRVVFHGRLSEAEKVELFDAAHVHLFTSHREGWGLTVSEAAARGTPTIGYDAPGVRDSIADARLHVPLRGGPAALATRLAEIHRDPDLYDQVRAAAWERARATSYDATTDRFLAALHA